jgi:hypothetical protein
LPTFDELVGTDDLDDANVHRALLLRTEADRDHVFTLHAELEGGLFGPAFEALLDGWRAQGHRLGSLADSHAELGNTALPSRPLTWGRVAGRSGELLLDTG